MVHASDREPEGVPVGAASVAYALECLCSVVDSGPGLTAAFSPQRRYLAASAAWRRFYALGSADLRGAHKTAPHGDGAPRWWAAHDAVVRGTPQRGELEACAGRDGRVRFLTWTARPFRVRDSVLAVIVELTDHSERVRVEQELEESELLQHQMLEGMQQGVSVLDRHLRCRMWNRVLEGFTGVAETEVLGRHPDEVFPFMREQGVVADLERSLAGESLTRPDTFIRGHWVSAHSAPLRNASGEVDGVMVTVSDVTQRVLQEQSLTEHAQRLNMVMRGLEVGAWDWNLSDDTVTFSEEWARQLGHEPAELLGHIEDWRSRLHPDDAAATLATLERLAATQRGEGEATYRLRHKDGSYRWVMSRAFVIGGAPGEPRRMLGINLDVTDRVDRLAAQKVLEAQLAQAQKLEALGTLAGGIAHDFNNLLGAMMGNAELAIRKLDADHPVLVYVERVLDASLHARDLVQRMLTLARPRSGTRKPVRVVSIVEEALALLQHSVPSTVRLRFHTLASPVVNADASQLLHVILNLAANAHQAMRDARGTIDITVSEERLQKGQLPHPSLTPGPYACLSVEDDGVGIDAATRERIFEPFFSTKHPERGTGLGLAMVHAIVGSHEGAIVVESELDRGSQFRVYLPALDQQVIVSEAPSEPAVADDAKRVLVVDDERSVRDVCVQMLELLGYDVAAASSGKEALELVRVVDTPFDLVISDLTMPEMTGDELARRLRQAHPGVKFLLMTGQDAELGEIAIAGSARVLSKPFSIKRLAEAASEALAGPHDIGEH